VKTRAAKSKRESAEIKDSMNVRPRPKTPSFQSVVSATSLSEVRTARANSSPSVEDPMKSDGFGIGDAHYFTSATGGAAAAGEGDWRVDHPRTTPPHTSLRCPLLREQLHGLLIHWQQQPRPPTNRHGWPETASWARLADSSASPFPPRPQNLIAHIRRRPHLFHLVNPHDMP